MANIVNMFPGGGVKVTHATGTAYTSYGGPKAVSVTGLGFYPDMVVATDSYSGGSPCRTRGGILPTFNIAPSVFAQSSSEKETHSVSDIFDGGFTLSRAMSLNGIYTWHAIKLG